MCDVVRVFLRSIFDRFDGRSLSETACCRLRTADRKGGMKGEEGEGGGGSLAKVSSCRSLEVVQFFFGLCASGKSRSAWFGLSWL